MLKAVVPLVDLSHLDGLALSVKRSIIARAFDDGDPSSLQALFQKLEAAGRGSARERFFAHRISGDAVCVGALRFARETDTRPVTEEVLRQCRATLAETVARLRHDALLSLAPTTAPQQPESA